MNMTNQMFIDLLKAYSRKYTHRKKVFSSAKGKMVWRYYYKEHHGGGVTKVENLEVGDAFKVNYNGVEGHFDVKKVKGNMVTVVHSETGKETPLTKAELRAVLLKTHAKALKRNVKKKEDALARTKNKRSRERAQQRLNMAKRKIQGLEAEQEDNFETMPETEQEPQAQAPKDARSSLVEQAEKVIQETHDKHEDKPLAHKPLDNYEVGEHTHTKTGEIAHTVKNKKRLSREDYLKHRNKAKELGGFYSKFTKKFHFRDKDKALEFAHHFEPVQDQAEEVKQDAKKEDHTHHENNFETMPEAHGGAEIIRTKNHYPFAVVLKNDTIDDLITRRLAYNKHKGQTTTYNQHLNDALNAQEYKKAKELRKDRFNVYNFETMAQAKAFIADMAQKEIKDNRTVNNSDKLVQHLKQAQEKITHEILENLGQLHSGDYQNFLEDADKKPRQRKFYSQDDFNLNIKITKHERKVTEGINFKTDKPATRRRKFQSGINNQAYDTVPFHELEAAIDKKHLPLINQKVSPSKEPLKLRFEVRDNKKSFNQGKTVLGINIIDEDLFRYRGSKTSKYFDHIEIDPVTLEIRHNWTIQGFRQENEIRELKDFLDTEINKLLDVAMPNTKRLDQIRDREAKEVEKAGYEYETNSKPLTEHFEQKTRAYTTRSKQASARAKGLLKEDARPMVWDAEQGEMKQAPVDARKQMIQTAEAVQDNFETMPDVAPKRSNKEILEQYDTSDLKIQSSEDFGKLDPQSSLKRHDYRMSIYRNTEDKLKDIDGGIINTFSYHTHGTLQARARERYNLNKVKADLKPTQIVEDSFYLTGYNDSVTNEYIAVDDGINKLAQKYEYIDDVRENKDAILAELKQMAQSTYENRIRGFESSFETDYKKKEVEKFYRKDLENALKDKQKALERLKGKLPSSVHQALETEVKQGLEQHTKDVEVMINHYNTELDKIVDKEKTAYRTKGDIYNTIQANLPKYKNPHLQGMYTGEKKFEAKVQGRPHKKLIAKMFNEIMEQVAQEKANEPTGLVQDNFETMPDAPTKPTNAREQMIQVAENVQDNFETMPEVDYESLNRGQKIKIQDKVYTVAVKRDRSFSSVGHAIQLNDENRKPAGILIFNDNGTVRFKDMKGLEDIKDLKEAQLITGNKEQSIKFKNDPREPLPKPTGKIIPNMSRKREAQKQTRQPRQPRQPRKEAPQTISTDQTDGLKGTFWEQFRRPEIKKLLSETVSAGHYESQLNQTGFTPSLYDLKQAVQATDKFKLLNVWHQDFTPHRQMVDFAQTGNLEPLKKLLADFRTDYLSIIARNALHNGFAKRAKIAIRDSETPEARELANQEYLDFEKQYLDRAEQIFKENRTETDAQVIQFIKEKYFKWADKLTPSEKTTITKRFDDAISKLSQPTDAREQMIQTAEMNDSFLSAIAQSMGISTKELKEQTEKHAQAQIEKKKKEQSEKEAKEQAERQKKEAHEQALKSYKANPQTKQSYKHVPKGTKAVVNKILKTVKYENVKDQIRNYIVDRELSMLEALKDSAEFQIYIRTGRRPINTRIEGSYFNTLQFENELKKLARELEKDAENPDTSIEGLQLTAIGATEMKRITAQDIENKKRELERHFETMSGMTVDQVRKPKIKKAYHKLNPRELLLKALTA